METVDGDSRRGGQRREQWQQCSGEQCKSERSQRVEKRDGFTDSQPLTLALILTSITKSMRIAS
jgi:hypothetical protein